MWLTSKQDVDYDYSCLQIDLPKDIANQIYVWGKENIPDTDLYKDEEAKGREDQIHVTIKYGLHTHDPKEITALLKDQPAISLALGTTAIFENKDKPYDVVYLSITSDDLLRLNKLVNDNLEYTNTTKGYEPHATIAYVNKGSGAKYINKVVVANKNTVSINSVTFSPSEGGDSKIMLKDKKEAWLKIEGETAPGSQERIIDELESVVFDHLAEFMVELQLGEEEEDRLGKQILIGLANRLTEASSAPGGHYND